MGQLGAAFPAWGGAEGCLRYEAVVPFLQEPQHLPRSKGGLGDRVGSLAGAGRERDGSKDAERGSNEAAAIEGLAGAGEGTTARTK